MGYIEFKSGSSYVKPRHGETYYSRETVPTIFLCLIRTKLTYPKESVPNASFSERFFHIFLKAESQEVVILCKLHVVFLYVCIILTGVKNRWEIISSP